MEWCREGGRGSESAHGLSRARVQRPDACLTHQRDGHPRVQSSRVSLKEGRQQPFLDERPYEGSYRLWTHFRRQNLAPDSERVGPAAWISFLRRQDSGEYRALRLRQLPACTHGCCNPIGDMRDPAPGVRGELVRERRRKGENLSRCHLVPDGKDRLARRSIVCRATSPFNSRVATPSAGRPY